MDVEFKILTEKRLVGKCLKTNLVNNKTGELWKSFMTKRKEIQNAKGTELYSVQVYDNCYFKNFNPNNEFMKWATVEVDNFENIPEGMEGFTLEGGLYAVVLHKGSSSDTSTFHYLFGKWLPASEYVLDDRPHFELLGEKYKNNNPDSEEEIWIPLKKK